MLSTLVPGHSLKSRNFYINKHLNFSWLLLLLKKSCCMTILTWRTGWRHCWYPIQFAWAPRRRDTGSRLNTRISVHSVDFCAGWQKVLSVQWLWIVILIKRRGSSYFQQPELNSLYQYTAFMHNSLIPVSIEEVLAQDGETKWITWSCRHHSAATAMHANTFWNTNTI